MFGPGAKYLVYAKGVIFVAPLGVFDDREVAEDFANQAKYDDDGYHEIKVKVIGYNIPPESCPVQFSSDDDY